MPTTVEIVTITGDLGGSDMVLLGWNFFYAMVYPQKPQRLDIHTKARDGPFGVRIALEE